MQQQPQADPNVKNITVTGVAATQTAGGPKRRRRTARAKQNGGSQETSELTPSKVNVIQQLTPPTPSSPAPATQSTQVQPGSQQGGAPQVKQSVKLVPARSKNKTRVLLAPKGNSSTTPQTGGASKTRKQKKFSLRVSNIRRKVASTRKHIHASTSLPIDKIRKELVDAKLLNPASKAPEALIRKIYADYKITTNKA